MKESNYESRQQCFQFNPRQHSLKKSMGDHIGRRCIGRLLEASRTRSMIFRLQEKEVRGTSAVDVVRALEREDKEYRHCGGPIRQYLSWSLNRLGGSVPARDLDPSDRLEDEALALDYLLLLDEYGVGKMIGKTD